MSGMTTVKGALQRICCFYDKTNWFPVYVDKNFIAR
jgi:hypothetical protein